MNPILLLFVVGFSVGAVLFASWPEIIKKWTAGYQAHQEAKQAVTDAHRNDQPKERIINANYSETPKQITAEEYEAAKTILAKAKEANKKQHGV